MRDDIIADPAEFVPESAYLWQKAQESEQYSQRYKRLALLAEEFEKEVSTNPDGAPAEARRDG